MEHYDMVCQMPYACPHNEAPGLKTLLYQISALEIRRIDIESVLRILLLSQILRAKSTEKLGQLFPIAALKLEVLVISGTWHKGWICFILF